MGILDFNRVPDKALPDRLQDAALNATYGPDAPGIQAAIDLAADAAAAASEPLLVGGKRAVRKDELVYNVLDYGVVGDGTTDDLAAIEALATAVSAAGGGVLYFPRRTYRISRAIRCKSNIEYRIDNATIKNTRTVAGSHPMDLAAFAPGFIHGYAFNDANPAGSIFSRVPVNDIPAGSLSVTATTAGGFATVAVGDMIAVRSVSRYLQGAVEIPSQLYYTKVVSITGDVLSLADPAPYAISGAIIQPLKGNPSDSSGIPMYMVENVKISGFKFDALFPVWGGGCYGFSMSNVRPAPGRDVISSFVTLNAMVKFTISDCEADWYYTFCELALGCSQGRIFKNSGTYRNTGTSKFHPISIVEGAHDIAIEENRLTVPDTFVDGTLNFINLAQCQDIRIFNNKIEAYGTINALAVVAGATVPERAVSFIRVYDNHFTSGVGVSRGIVVGATAAAYPAKGISIRDNVFSGSFNPAVNEWIWLNEALDYVVKDNIIPDGVKQRTGTNARGRFNGGEQSSSTASHVVTPSAMSAQITPTTTTKNMGRVQLNGVVSVVRVEVLTAFNGGTNILHVGHSAVNNAYASTIDLGVPAVTYIYPSHAKAGVGLGKRLTTTDRDILSTYIQTGAAATAGSALVTVYYEPTTPPVS